MANSIRGFALVFAVLLSGCENATQTPSGRDLGEFLLSRTYRVEGDKFIYAIQSDTVASCSGSALITTVNPLRYDTNLIELSRDSLRLVGDTATSDSVKFVDITHFARVGSGTGLEGTWRDAGSSERVVSGTYSPATASVRERYRAFNDGMREILTRHYVFGNGELRGYMQGELSTIFIYRWTHPSYLSYAESTSYAISVRAVDAKTVEMKGLVTGEVVTQRLSLTGKEGNTYSSDNPAHLTSQHPLEPRECPYRQDPEWYVAFLKANKK